MRLKLGGASTDLGLAPGVLVVENRLEGLNMSKLYMCIFRKSFQVGGVRKSGSIACTKTGKPGFRTNQRQQDFGSQ